MSAYPKYVVFLSDDGLEDVELLPSWRGHDEVFKGGRKIVAAGSFCLTINVGTEDPLWPRPWVYIFVRCFGESTSLGVKARPEKDRQLIEKFLRLHKIDF